MSTDEKDGKTEHRAAAIRQIGAAVLAAPGASEGERALARAVLGTLEAQVALGGRELPLEAATAVQVFNRQLDTVLDAANNSHGARERSSRRVHMAGALGRAGLVLISADELARLVIQAAELELGEDLPRHEVRELS